MKEEMTTLGESCQFFNGKAHEKDIDAEGQFVVVNSKFISTDGEVRKFTAKQMFPLVVNDIVMVMSDVPNGKALAKCYMIEENDKYSLNQRICAIRTTEFNIRFLYYQLNRHPYLLGFNNGENQTNLRKGDILDCPLWKPSLNVQEHIVKILDEALDQIEQAQSNIEQNINNTKELFQSKLNEIFSQKGEDWEEKKLLEVVTLKSGTTLPKALEKTEGKIPYLKVSDMNIAGNEFEITTSTKFVNPGDIKEKNILPQGTIVFPKRGGAIATNKKRITSTPICVDLNTMGAIPSPSIYSEFLHFYFRSFDLMDIANGTTIPQINNYSFESLRISFPKDKSMQYELVETLENIRINLDEVANSYYNKLISLAELKLSILMKAFSGELTKEQPTTV